MTHGRIEEARRVVEGIERRVGVTTAGKLPRVRLRAREHTPLAEVFGTILHRHRRRALVGLALMTAQAFFYNAIFFTYALVLTDFYGIPAAAVGWYILPFAAGNFLGPLMLGRLFDVIGRRVMIAFTYIVSGVLLLGSGYLFEQGVLSAAQQTLCWTVIFFFASAAASSAYLTVSETFPLEIRALAIAMFYAVGTGSGRHGGTMAVRCADRHRLAGKPVRRLPARRGADDRGGRDRGALCGGRRAPAAGGRGAAARLRRIAEVALRAGPSPSIRWLR